MYFPIFSFSEICRILWTSILKLWELGFRIWFDFSRFLSLYIIKLINSFSFWFQFSEFLAFTSRSNSSNLSKRVFASSSWVNTKVSDVLIEFISTKYFETLLMILTKSSYQRILKFFFDKTIKILPFCSVFKSLTVPMLFVMSISTPRLSSKPGVSIVLIFYPRVQSSFNSDTFAHLVTDIMELLILYCSAIFGSSARKSLESG